MSYHHVLNLNARPVIDLAMSAFETTHKGIRVTGTWFMDPETNRSQPCLALTDTRRPVRSSVPCIITLDTAWRWTVEMGEPEHVWPLIRSWIAEGILPGTPTNDPDLWTVFDAVQCRLRDMMTMPPMPMIPALKYRTPPEQVGELVIREKNSGKVLKELGITANV